MKTWSQVRQVRLLREICDYIFGTYHLRFDVVLRRDVITYASEHFSLQDRLLYPAEAG